MSGGDGRCLGDERIIILFHRQVVCFECALAISTLNHNTTFGYLIAIAVVPYSHSTSNHNFIDPYGTLFALYLIRILHQITTICSYLLVLVRLYLIRILHQITTARVTASTRSPLYLIRILHQITTIDLILYCGFGCTLFAFYIKSQHHLWLSDGYCGCTLFAFYIKSQHDVVPCAQGVVVPYSHSTSNHNFPCTRLCGQQLYLIRILHQITTRWTWTKQPPKLYLIRILHQITTIISIRHVAFRCTLFAFYIKSQLLNVFPYNPCVVPYSHSTSNHNFRGQFFTPAPLYLIRILHQITTGFGAPLRSYCCTLFAFYIKSQPST